MMKGCVRGGASLCVVDNRRFLDETGRLLGHEERASLAIMIVCVLQGPNDQNKF